MSEMPVDGMPVISPRVTLWRIFAVFGLIGATSFGGGVVAYLRAQLVTATHWLDDGEFLELLEVSQTLPGLNATNMAVLVGDKLRGIPGAVAGLIGMMLPGSLFIAMLGAAYATYGGTHAVTAILGGVAAAAVGVMTAVTLQIGRKQLDRWSDLALVAATLAAVSGFHLSLLTVLGTLGPVAVLLHWPHKRPRPTGEAQP